jgi:hypothetical protein
MSVILERLTYGLGEQMRMQYTSVVVAGSMCLAWLTSTANAQFDLPLEPSGYVHDAQMFAPAEMDLDGLIIGEENQAGVFFSWEKIYWSTGGELVTVGDPNISRALPPVWMDQISAILNPVSLIPDFSPNPPFLDQQPIGQQIGPGTGGATGGGPIDPNTGNAINRPIYINSIQEVAPDAAFRSADRYEFGYNYEDHGWLIGVLQGPEQQTGQMFGTNGGMQEGQGDLQSPLGDVYIAFDYEEGLMHGFQDLWIAAVGTGRVLPADTDGDGILDGDGYADDMDGDGQYGPDGYDTVDPAFEPDAALVGPAGVTISGPPDYDDLVELPTAFRTVLVRNAATTSGVEIMAMQTLDNRHWQAKHQNYNRVQLLYGVRYLRFRDNFVVDAEGGVLGLSTWDTQIINNIVGPQVALNWMQRRGRWSANVNGRFTFGYNVSNWDQNGFLGEDLTPGRHNHPLYLRAHSFKYGRRDNDFSPIVEMRMELAYNFTRSVALKAGWTGLYVGNVYRASTHVRYHIPNMGFLLGNPEHVIINGINGGIEFNY